MLPRSQRLNAREFAIVFENAQVVRHPLLQLRLYKHQPDTGTVGRTRAAFVAPKKLGNAVVRNSIRRRVRERYRILQAAALSSQQSNSCSSSPYPWPVALKDCDLVFLATEQCQGATIQQIDESLSQLLKRAGQKAATATRQGIENRSTPVS